MKTLNPMQFELDRDDIAALMAALAAGIGHTVKTGDRWMETEVLRLLGRFFDALREINMRSAELGDTSHLTRLT